MNYLYHCARDDLNLVSTHKLFHSLQCVNTASVCCIADGIDGKQARRTGTSGPLGELFDHGLDSWATFFMPVGMYSLFGRGDYGVGPVTVYWVLIGVMLTFVASHWEKYNTGVLFLPWGYDASQMVSVGHILDAKYVPNVLTFL